MESKHQSDTLVDASSAAPKLILYSYWRSSCSWRVRFALNLKGLPYEYRAVNLAKGEQYTPEFEKLNPLHYVPVLVDGDVVISDSYAIILYLEEKYPQKPLLPADPQLKALNLQAASIVCSSMQPLLTLPVLTHVGEKLGPEEQAAWAHFYIEKGYLALEKLFKDFASKHATGEEAHMADVFLAPQIAINTMRFNVDMVRIITERPVNNAYEAAPQSLHKHDINIHESKFPTLSMIYESCKALPEFQASAPDGQPDTVPKEKDTFLSSFFSSK